MLLSVTLGIPIQEIYRWPSSVISLYMAYHRVEPMGEQRADLRNAMLMQQTAEMWRDPNKRAEPFRYEDFMPFYDRKEPKTMNLRRKARALFGLD